MKIMPKTNMAITFVLRRAIFLSLIIIPSLFVGVGCQLSTPASENNREGLLIEGQVSYQENSISLNSAELEQPLYLKITTSNNTKLIGQIFLEDQALAELKNNLTIDLSPLLQPGKNLVSITGNYEPKSNSVSVKLQGKNSQSTTSTEGDGTIHQKLIIRLDR